MAYENLTTFTEVEETGENHWTVSEFVCSSSQISNNNESYIYKDYGVDYFENYTFFVNVSMPGGALGGTVGLCSISNTFGTIQDVYTNTSAITQLLRLYKPASNGTLYLEGRTDGSTIDGDSCTISVAVTYYLKVYRIGATTYCKVYNTSDDRLNDVNVRNTLSISCSSIPLRYMQCGFSYGAGSFNQMYSSASYFEFQRTEIIETDTFTLSDDIYLNLSRETIELDDTITISDSIYLKPSKETIELNDTISLSDGIYLFLGKNILLEDTITISDEIEVNIPTEYLYLDDTVIISDDIYVAIPTKVIEDIDNDFRTVKQEVNDIPNKINTVIRVLKSCVNVFSMLKSLIPHIDNDIRTRGRTINNITNDFRMLSSFQVPGDAGFQSLGKEYIKVYINSIENTYVDIDSITITQSLGTAHTASFTLGLPYDSSSKPSEEQTVEIKYNNYILYKGYVTNISPTDSPDTISIGCQDVYWYQNKTKKYFFVGHKPTDVTEKYYDTIAQALSSELSWSSVIGNFVPQTMNLFGVGASDCVTQLVQNSGTFDWFYHLNKNTGTISKRLWTASQGSILSLEPQILDKNIGLYQIINHSFVSSIAGIVNKLRVQMGQKVIRRVSSTGKPKEYTGYDYRVVRATALPDWNADYEVLAKDSSSGYGWDYHKEEANSYYKDVFKRYRLPQLDPELSSWTDTYPPKVSVSVGWGNVGFVSSEQDGTMLEGFTIDYENGLLTFNDPVYLQKTINAEITSIKRPQISLLLWKKQYYSRTETPTDNPQSDISNPLMFFTDKMGDYPETIWKSLELTGLGIQVGAWYRDNEGHWNYIPSWNDTAFAHDYADWELSKTCDIKTRGNIELTIDAMCFYDIDLSKRVNIDGVIDNPLNITSITYNIDNFTAQIDLENFRHHKRIVSIPQHGESL